MTEFLDACYQAIRKQETSFSETLTYMERKEFKLKLRDKRIVLVGAGDSYAVAKYGEWAFREIGYNVMALSAPEICRVPVYEEHVVIGVTASGRSLSTIAALEHARTEGAHTVILTDNADGSAAKKVDEIWTTKSGVDSYDISPSAPTTAAMVFLLKLVVIEQAVPRTRIHQDIHKLERIGKDMVDWAEVVGKEIADLVDLHKPLYFVSDGPNHVAAQLGQMKFNEYSLVKTMVGIREDYTHHWNLSLNPEDRVVLISDSPTTPEDSVYLKVLSKTLRMKTYHLFTSEDLYLESALGQAIANTIALQMAAYYTVLKYDSQKDKWKEPNASAFKIY